MNLFISINYFLKILINIKYILILKYYLSLIKYNIKNIKKHIKNEKGFKESRKTRIIK